MSLLSWLRLLLQLFAVATSVRKKCLTTMTIQMHPLKPVIKTELPMLKMLSKMRGRIKQHIAYEYGRRGAYLVIGARRENTLQQVADMANWFGSPSAVPIRTDISKVEDCKRLIEEEAINQFGQLDHLVMCAGVTPVSMFEDLYDVTKVAPAMDINFWGLAYLTYFAAAHLRKTNGKIVVIAWSASWLNESRLSFYGASKAAVVSFFETLCVEFGSDIGITIVTPWLIESEVTKGKFLNMDGEIVVDQQLRDVVMSAVPIERVDRLANATEQLKVHAEETST